MRSRGFVIAAVVVAAVAVAGLVAARSDFGNETAAAVGSPGAASAPSGAVSASGGREGPGPSGERDGVPVGWRHDVAGAEAAAMAYVGVTGQAARSGPLLRRDMLGQLATEAYAGPLADRVNGQMSDLLHRLGDKGWNTGGMVWVEYPLSVRSDPAGSGPDQVRVSVWSVTVFALPSGSVSRQLWRTSDLEMVWQRGDWKVDRWEAREGPSPTPSTEAPPSDGRSVANVAGWRPASGGGPR